MASTTLPLSQHLHCAAGPPHEAPALRVLGYSVPRSHRPEDGVEHHLLPLCGHPSCEASAIRSTPADAVLEPVRDLTAADVVDHFGVELDVSPWAVAS